MEFLFAVPVVLLLYDAGSFPHIVTWVTFLHEDGAPWDPSLHQWPPVQGNNMGSLLLTWFKDSGNSSSRFFISEFHLFNKSAIFNDIDFKFSAVADNNITFDSQQ